MNFENNEATTPSTNKSKRGAVIELIVSILAVICLGDFIAGHTGELRFLVPAVLLDICAIAFLGTRVLQLSVMSALDAEGSSEAQQNALEKLHRLRKHTATWTTALSFVLWMPLVIVGFEGLFGVDVWQIVGAVSEQGPSFYAWILGNLAFGAVAALGVIWLSKRSATVI